MAAVERMQPNWVIGSLEGRDALYPPQREQAPAALLPFNSLLLSFNAQGLLLRKSVRKGEPLSLSP